MFRFLEKLQNALGQFMGRLINSLANLGAALVRPIERLFQMLGQAGLWVTDHFESFMASLGIVLLWPFLMLWRALAAIATRLLPESLRHVIAAPFHGLGRFLRGVGRLLMRAAEALNLDGLVMWIVWLLQPIWRPVAALGSFLYAWAATRNYRQMLWGIPAILILLPFLIAATKTVVFGKMRVVGQYRTAIQEAQEEGDFQQVQLFERKLAQLGADTKLMDFRTAGDLAKDGKLKKAYRQMQRLAPTEMPGYAGAHYWIIQSLLSQRLEVPKKEAMQLTEIHLDHLETLGFKGPEIQLLRAHWLMQSERLSEAVEVLKPLVLRMPEAAVQRMQILLSLKKFKEARQDARSVRMHMQDRKRLNRPFTSQEYSWWASAEEVLGDISKMKSILQAWHTQEPEDLQVRLVLANIHRRDFFKLLYSPHPNTKSLANLLFEADEISNDATSMPKIVSILYLQQSQIPAARELVEELLQSSRTSLSIRAALGSSASIAGDLGLAKKLLQQVVQEDPNRAVAWNNYAWVLSLGSEEDLAQALTAVDRSLALLEFQSPHESQVRETRGQILVQLKHWQKAIPDLEFAVNRMPGNKEIHQSLAQAYDALGNSELASAHRQRGE